MFVIVDLPVQIYIYILKMFTYFFIISPTSCYNGKNMSTYILDAMENFQMGQKLDPWYQEIVDF